MAKKKDKKEKRPPVKKEPQRGMGVATLERLRLQERYKVLSNSDQLPSLTQPHLQLQFPFSYLDQTTHGVPVSYPRHPPMNLVPDSSITFPPYHRAGGGGCGVSYGVPSVVSERYEVDRLRMMNQEMNRFHAVQELHSSQMQCVSNNCDVCLKKRLDAEILALQKEREKIQMNRFDSLGLSLGRNNTNTIYEEAGVHRNGNAVNGGGNVFMEYEFFPGSNNTSNNSVSVAGVSSDGSQQPKLDLSLKLSC